MIRLNVVYKDNKKRENNKQRRACYLYPFQAFARCLFVMSSIITIFVGLYEDRHYANIGY